MDKRDLALAILGLCALYQFSEPIAGAVSWVRYGGAWGILSQTASVLGSIDMKDHVVNATGEYCRAKRHIWYNAKTLGGWLDTTKGKVAELDGLAHSFPECANPSWRDYMGLAVLFLPALLAVLLVFTALKFVYKYLYNKFNWEGVKYFCNTVAMWACCGTGAYVSPETAIAAALILGYFETRRRISDFNFHPMPTLNYTDPDTRGIIISETSMPPVRKVGVNEMAIPGVQTNKTELKKAPFAFLICSEKWETVIGMGFRVEIDGRDVLVTVLHVHAAWAQKKAEEGYMHIYGKNGRAKFKPEIVFASRALDLVYYKYPSTIGEAGVAKGKHYTKDTSGSAIWVLSPALKGDNMIESSCASSVSYAPYHITHWASTRPGSSGSPIFTKDGIVGVHRGSDGVRANYGVYLFVDPQRARKVLETSAPKTQHYNYEGDFVLDDYHAGKKAEALRRAIEEDDEWFFSYDDDEPIKLPLGWKESRENGSSSEGGRREFDPPGMCPVHTGPWFLDTIQDGEVLIYPVGFKGRLSVGKPISKTPENAHPAQKISPASGTTVGSSETGQSSSPGCKMTLVQGSNLDIQELGKQISASLESALTRVVEMQAQTVQGLRALKEPQPCVQSSTGGVSQTGGPQQNIPLSSTKLVISKRAEKRARKNAVSSSNGLKSATPAATEQTNMATLKIGAT